MRNREHIVMAWLLLLGALVPGRDHARAKDPEPLVVITARASGISDVSLATLRRAFLGEYAEYGAGKRLLAFNQPVGSAERIAFDRAVLGLSADAVGRFWITRRIRDEGLAPRSVATAELGMRVVAYPGAVFYMRERPLPTRLRILSIDGAMPGEADYLLPSL